MDRRPHRFIFYFFSNTGLGYAPTKIFYFPRSIILGCDTMSRYPWEVDIPPLDFLTFSVNPNKPYFRRTVRYRMASERYDNVQSTMARIFETLFPVFGTFSLRKAIFVFDELPLDNLKSLPEEQVTLPRLAQEKGKTRTETNKNNVNIVFYNWKFWYDFYISIGPTTKKMIQVKRSLLPFAGEIFITPVDSGLAPTKIKYPIDSQLHHSDDTKDSKPCQMKLTSSFKHISVENTNKTTDVHGYITTYENDFQGLVVLDVGYAPNDKGQYEWTVSYSSCWDIWYDDNSTSGIKNKEIAKLNGPILEKFIKAVDAALNSLLGRPVAIRWRDMVNLKKMNQSVANIMRFDRSKFKDAFVEGRDERAENDPVAN
jgi:hypothetical protein